jgi:hypothetical protein
MTITLDPTQQAPQALVPVAFDFYRDIHKAIRAKLFELTLSAGRIDPSDEPARVELAARVGRTADLLLAHAEHEDGTIQPAIEAHLPALAERIAGDHLRVDAKLVSLRDCAVETVEAGRADRRFASHCLYIELASFTATYLEHQDVEERLVMPALETAIGMEAVVAIHHQLLDNMPPEDLMGALAIMIPAINLEDRTEMLAGIRSDAPAYAFDVIWELTQTVLTPPDAAALAARLDVS